MVRRHSVRTTVLGAVAAVLAGSLLSPSAAEAQRQREGRWQFSIPLNFVSGTEIKGQGESFLRMNDDLGWGFSFGYHINNRFMVGGEMTWMRANYDAQVEVDEDGDEDSDGLVTIGGTLDASTFGAFGQFNILEGPITPFVQGKLGTTYSDSNIPSGPTQGVCWWDPWWGYICDAWRPTYSTWSFSYGGAVGLRAELGRTFFLEGAYSAGWIDFDVETPRLDGFRLNVGWIL